MNEFAIVSEGVTDYAVLKNILLGWFKGQDAEPFLKPYQPDPTAEGESAWQEFGNWENVIKYLAEKKHRDALEFADFLITKRKVLLAEGRKNPSLEIFLNELERRSILLTVE